MDSDPKPIREERPLTSEERRLARWMLENGESGATAYLPQLERARVVSRCPCGCASIDFEIEGHPPPEGGLRILGDYLYGDEIDVYGIFIFESRGVLAGIEVWGVSAETPTRLPEIGQLRPAGGGGSTPQRGFRGVLARLTKKIESLGLFRGRSRPPRK